MNASRLNAAGGRSFRGERQDRGIRRSLLIRSAILDVSHYRLRASPVHEAACCRNARSIRAIWGADPSTLDDYRQRGFDVETQEPAFGAEQESLPWQVVASRPGDVAFFDQNLFHSSFGGRSGRRMFTLCYCTVPEDEPARASMQESYEGSHRAVKALSYGRATPGGDGVHHPAVLRTDRPTLRRLTEPLVERGWV